VSPLNLHSKIGKSLYRTYLSSEILEVREEYDYRWFHYGGDIVQAVIDTSNPENILLPVPQSMLMFLLWQKPPFHVLNLGMGAGTIENALSKLSCVEVTSVEAEFEIIKMAKRYFLSTENSHIVHDKAEEFLQVTASQYDIILCDIFFQQQSPKCLYRSTYYQDLKKKLSRSGTVFINLFPENEESLLHIMSVSRPYFKHITLIEFDDYQNIVLILSQVSLPTKEQLISCDNLPDKLTNISFKEHINNMHFVPVKVN